MVLSGAALCASSSQSCKTLACGMPQTRSTISTV